jgi:2-phosphoglycerate kinase
MNANFPRRSWQVLLIGGASGVGKTSVSYRIAQHFGVGITEVDDFQVILERMTTPAEQPVLHYWRTHPDPSSLSAEQIVEQTIAVGHVMLPALEAVIANHLESQAPVVLEGDYILPAVISQSPVFAQHVRAIFLYEDDEEQLRQNFLRREPEEGVQEMRARVSWLYGKWLKEEAERVGAFALSARPWDDVFERILAILQVPLSEDFPH